MPQPCPACLSGHCPLHESGTDPNINDYSDLRNVRKSDYERSVRLWQEQDAANAAERERLIREVERNQARERADLADFLSHGGRL